MEAGGEGRAGLLSRPEFPFGMGASSDSWTDGEAYDALMGRWSRTLAPQFVKWARLPRARRSLTWVAEQVPFPVRSRMEARPTWSASTSLQISWRAPRPPPRPRGTA